MDRYRPSYNVAPGAHLPVFRVRRSSPEGGEAVADPVVECMKWGLVPSFTKKIEKPDHYRMFFDTGEILHTFTILTTRSSSTLEWLHDRMPVILSDNVSIDIWLNDSSAKHETILVPCEDPDLVWYPVTPAMGKPSFDGSECIKEIQLKPAGEKPISMFFAKKTEDKNQPEHEFLKSSKQEYVQDSLKEEPGTGDTQEKIANEEIEDKTLPENEFMESSKQ